MQMMCADCMERLMEERLNELYAKGFRKSKEDEPMTAEESEVMQEFFEMVESQETIFLEP